MLDGLRELFGVPVVEAYGMTEASHQMTCNPLPPGSAKPGSVGVPAGIEVAILDGRQHELPPAQRGEVAIQGATVVDGYENNPDGQRGRVHRTDGSAPATKACSTRTATCSSPAGSRSRSTAAARRSRRSRSTTSCSRHPAVAEAVTFAIPHDKLGEEVGAAVVLRRRVTSCHRERAA